MHTPLRWLSTALVVLMLSVQAIAAPPARVAPTADSARLTVGKKLIAILRTKNGTLGPADRAELAAQRLNDLIERGLEAGQIEARPRGNDWALYAADQLIMVATPAESATRQEKPSVTAERWVSNLRAALADLPDGKSADTLRGRTKHDKDGKSNSRRASRGKRTRLEPEAASLTVPMGETRRITILGETPGEVVVEVEGEKIAAAGVTDIKEASAEIQVRGLGPGKTVVRVSRGEQNTAFTVWVKKFAGVLAETPVARVTGRPAPADLVRRAAAELAVAGVVREEGARVEVTGPAAGAQALDSGKSAKIRFPISITGPGLLDVTTEATVEVQNLDLTEQETRTLLYSNDPESVREYGVLFEGLVSPEGPVRMLYHHQNRMGKAFSFQIYLLNPGDEPVQVQIIQGEAGPYKDPIQAGHRAGERFLSAFTRDVGPIVRIPPKSVRPLLRERLDHLLTVSGVYSFRVVEGGPLVAHVSATAEPTAPQADAEALAAAQDEPHTYAMPDRNQSFQYEAGGRWLFMPLGKDAISGRTERRKLFGNYGVIYRIEIELNNPRAEEQAVRLVLTPDSGVARGVFLIEGRVVEAAQVAPPGEALLWRGKLAPGEKRKLSLQALPVGGTAYPVSLVVRP